MATITLCMIVKNERDWIAQAIQSVSSIVAEVIVVDTGSEDDTAEIAKSLGAKVFHEPWQDDFAHARNFSIERASGDWILILDADEAIAEEDLATIQAMTADPRICWEFLQRHYTDDPRISDFVPVSGEFPKWEKGHGGYFESNCVRMFPHRAGLNYQGRVHELVEHSIHALGKHTIKRTPVRIHHYGHTRKVRDSKKKGTLYTPLGVAKAAEQSNDWKAFFELGVEHNNNGRSYESVDAFRKSVALNPSYIQSWINLGYVLCELRQYADAEEALKRALSLQSNHPEAMCNLGIVYLRTDNVAQAEMLFRHAVQLNPAYINARCNLGVTLANQGRLSEAALAYRQVIERFPRCIEAQVSLGTLYLRSGVASEAEKHLKLALEYDPKHTRAMYHLGLLYKTCEDFKSAITIFEMLSVLQAERLASGALDAELFLQRANAERTELKHLM